MSAWAAAFILAVAFVTAILSGVFGMAGGLILMGALALVLSVQAAFVTHGLIQIVANGWRAVLHRAHIRWRIIGFYSFGAALAAAIVATAGFAPSKPLLFLMLGLVSFLAWLPRRSVRLDASRPVDAAACGLSVTGLNLSAGVAGPMLDVFFVKADLTRHQIVATKAATQVLSHLAKIIVFGAPFLSGPVEGMPPWWLFAVAIPLSVLGTVAGGRILDRMSDAGFLAWSKWIITGIGVVYLIQSARLWMT